MKVLFLNTINNIVTKGESHFSKSPCFNKIYLICSDRMSVPIFPFMFVSFHVFNFISFAHFPTIQSIFIFIKFRTEYNKKVHAVPAEINYLSFERFIDIYKQLSYNSWKPISTEGEQAVHLRNHIIIYNACQFSLIYMLSSRFCQTV